jgi:thiol-disulfide isomerase/thioredoxin
MKNLILPLLFTLIANRLYSQEFRIQLSSEDFLGDSLYLGTAEGAPFSDEEMLNFSIQESRNLIDLRGTFETPLSFYLLKFLEPAIILEGYIEFPKPVNLMILDFNSPEPEPNISRRFFVEPGNYTLKLEHFKNKEEISFDSPTNTDYKNLRSKLSEVIIPANNPLEVDSVINFEEKQQIIARYLETKPNSYAALWELIMDYSSFAGNPKYLYFIDDFSEEIKNGALYKRFLDHINNRSKTEVGGVFPDTDFGGGYKMSREDFGQNELTFVFLWATWCGPCIKAMPEISKFYNEYKSLGFGTIGVAGEDQIDKIEIAKGILKKNETSFTNYFDLNSDFRFKVNATVYPTYFLIDKQGEIVLRQNGDFEQVKKKALTYLKDRN